MTDKNPADPVEDQELHDLLDSALLDFSRKPVADTEEDSATQNSNTAEKAETDVSLEDAWTRDFIRQAADQFEENLQHLMQNGGDTEFGASFQKMAQTVASVMSETEGINMNTANTDFQSAITKALNDLSASSENLQLNSQLPNDTDLSELLAQTSLGDDSRVILPFIQDMVHNLLSKEVLYPPLKEFLDKYPEWLEEKRDSLSPEDLEKYTKQLEILKKVCSVLEEEKPNETQEERKKHMDTIVLLLEEAYKCGQLPKELVGDQGDPFQFDSDSSQNCSVM